MELTRKRAMLRLRIIEKIGLINRRVFCTHYFNEITEFNQLSVKGIKNCNL